MFLTKKGGMDEMVKRSDPFIFNWLIELRNCENLLVQCIFRTQSMYIYIYIYVIHYCRIKLRTLSTKEFFGGITLSQKSLPRHNRILQPTPRTIPTLNEKKSKLLDPIGLLLYDFIPFNIGNSALQRIVKVDMK